MSEISTQTEEQVDLPGVESRQKLLASAMAMSVSTKELSEIYDWNIRTVQEWAKDGVIISGSAGLFPLGESLKKIDHWRVDTINRKIGEEGSKKQGLELQRLEEQVKQLQIENDKLTGKLRDSSKVERVALARARLEAEMLGSLPSRLKSILAAETDEFKIGEVLKKEVESIARKTIEMSKSQW